MSTCSHCDKPVWSYDLCRLHDGRKRQGVPLDAPKGGFRQTPLERFWQRVDVNPDGCWSWTGGRVPNGYGKFWVGGQTLIAHRWLYTTLIGPVDDGLTLDHICRNRLCVRPDHLEIVTVKENVLRGVGYSAVNSRKTHCIHGHPFNQANTRLNKDGSRGCRTCARNIYWRQRGTEPEATRV